MIPKRLIEGFQCFAPVHWYNNKPNISNCIDGSLYGCHSQKMYHLSKSHISSFVTHTGSNGENELYSKLTLPTNLQLDFSMEMVLNPTTQEHELGVQKISRLVKSVYVFKINSWKYSNLHSVSFPNYLCWWVCVGGWGFIIEAETGKIVVT